MRTFLGAICGNLQKKNTKPTAIFASAHHGVACIEIRSNIECTRGHKMHYQR